MASPEPPDSVERATSADPAASSEPTATPEPMVSAKPTEPRFSRWMGSLWLYTLLRFALFLALWGILLLLGLGGFLAALIALVLSVPISLFALSRPRAAVTRQMEARVSMHHQQRADLDERLQHDD